MRSLLLLLLLMPSVSISQITLTSNDFADGGDTVRMSTTTDLAIDIITTGANQTWDYSGLVAESQYLMDFQDMSNASFIVDLLFGTFASPDYQASYYLPNEDLPLDQVGGFLPVNITDVFQFSKKMNDSITSVGYAISVDGNEVPFKSDTIETRYKLPLTFSDTYSSSGYTNMDLNPFVDAIWRQYRQRSSEVDGWGSITTPYGTFDALRIKHTISEVDSIRFDIFGTGSPIWIPLTLPDSYVYEWWTSNEKEAILRINTSVIVGNEVVSGIEYRDNYQVLGTNEITANSNFKIYPNPVMSSLNIYGLEKALYYSITDNNGKVIMSDMTSSKVDVSALQPGIYHIIFNDSGQISTTKFIKK